MSVPARSPATHAPAPRPAPARPRSYHFPRFERRTLDNGLQLIVAPVSKLPIVTVMAIVDAGAVAEPSGKEGVAALTARLLPEGAGGIDGAALADRFERIGASVESRADWDLAAVSLTALSAHLPEALELVRDLVRAPDFPAREVARLKDERLAELLQQRAEPRGLADEQFARALYSASARYAAPAEGDATSVRGISRDDVRAFYDARYRPPATTLIFVGDVTTDQATALADRLFGDWRGGPAAAVAADVDRVQSGRLVRVVAKADAPQSEVRIGHRGVSRNTPDYFDVVVMNAVLGGLFSSRINLNLREAHGYTYGAFSSYDWRRHAGPFVVHTAVKSGVTDAAIREILSEIERMRTGEVSADELTLATSYLDGVFPIRYETTAAIAAALANLTVYRLPDDYYDSYRARVRKVTTSSVLRAAQTHLHPEELRIVVVGDPSVIAGPMTEALRMPVDIVLADTERIPPVMEAAS